MKQIHYSLICEDIAHSTFIGEFLKAASKSQPEIAFLLNSECYDPYKFSNKSNVINFYSIVSARWFSSFNLDLLFVIADFDGWEKSEFTKHHDELLEALRADVKEKTLILLPVQAIEYWLYHILWKMENPLSTKNISIENDPRPEMKKKIYGCKRPSKELSEKTVRNIMLHFNPDWLKSRSHSFAHFYERFLKFVEA
jgi:hypothetical protein